MADQISKSGKASGVSPARKAVSAVILVIALAVLGIELRAGLGQMNSGKALDANSDDGFFENLTLADARGLLAFFPAEEPHQETNDELVYRYSWFSLLRPLMGQPQPELFLVTRKSDPPRVINFYTDAEDPAAALYDRSGDDGSMEALPMPGMSGMTRMIPPADGPDSMPAPGRRPAADDASTEPEAAAPESVEPEPAEPEPAEPREPASETPTAE